MRRKVISILCVICCLMLSSNVVLADEVLVENSITRAEVAQMIASTMAERLGETIEKGTSVFSDVDENKEYAKSVAYLEKYDIIKGYEDGAFRPSEYITRAEFACLCCRFYEYFDHIPVNVDNIYSDVPFTHWAIDSILDSAGMNWMHGFGDGTYRPEGLLTKSEANEIFQKVKIRQTYTVH